MQKQTKKTQTAWDICEKQGFCSPHHSNATAKYKDILALIACPQYRHKRDFFPKLQVTGL